MTHTKAIVIMLAAGTLAISAGAKVFWARPASPGHTRLTTTLNGKTIYTSAVRINEGQGNLVITGFDTPLANVVAKLRQAYAACKILTPLRLNENMGFARMREGDQIITLLALAPNSTQQTLLFVLTQAQDDFEKSCRPPTNAQLRTPLPYPGSRAQTCLTSMESRMQLEIYSAPAAPEAVHQYYENVLRAQTWTRLNSTGLVIYQKGPELCAVLALPSANGTASTITVLHKRLQME